MQRIKLRRRRAVRDRVPPIARHSASSRQRSSPQDVNVIRFSQRITRHASEYSSPCSSYNSAQLVKLGTLHPAQPNYVAQSITNTARLHPSQYRSFNSIEFGQRLSSSAPHSTQCTSLHLHQRQNCNTVNVRPCRPVSSYSSIKRVQFSKVRSARSRHCLRS